MLKIGETLNVDDLYDAVCLLPDTVDWTKNSTFFLKIENQDKINIVIEVFYDGSILFSNSKKKKECFSKFGAGAKIPFAKDEYAKGFHMMRVNTGLWKILEAREVPISVIPERIVL